MSIKILTFILIQRELMIRAYINRGYLALGGEFLVLPLVYVMHWFYNKLKEERLSGEKRANAIREG